jgi:hypothetical protein
LFRDIKAIFIEDILISPMDVGKIIKIKILTFTCSFFKFFSRAKSLWLPRVIFDEFKGLNSESTSQEDEPEVLKLLLRNDNSKGLIQN